MTYFLQVIALKVKRNSEWKTWTYERYLREVQLVARGFIHIGMNRHHSVAVIGRNTPEWVISDLAAIFAGYTTFFSCTCSIVKSVQAFLTLLQT